MEDIKTSLDKMLAKFNDSVTHSAPKKLSFENMNDSLNDSGTSEYTKTDILVYYMRLNAHAYIKLVAFTTL